MKDLIKILQFMIKLPEKLILIESKILEKVTDINVIKETLISGVITKV